MARLRKLAAYLDSPTSVVSKYTPKGRSRHSVIDVITIRTPSLTAPLPHLPPSPAPTDPSAPPPLAPTDSSDRHALELFDFPQPSIFPAHDPRAAYKKIYCDGPSYHRGDGRAYEAFGISKEEGAVVVVRPDMYTALVTGLEDTDVLDQYFGGFMLEAEGGGFPGSECGVVQPPVWDDVPKADPATAELPAALPA